MKAPISAIPIYVAFGSNVRGEEKGKGVEEVGRRADTGQIVIKIDPRYFRPTEVDELLGDSSKAKEKLNW